ncbi:MAG TPA: 2Fe-2S iron-sulfur cluster-binding protein [Pyrinomonadaceae bacterium]|nr:2Fe-2S iron-sulfur cluster-binding protein [Pyrinomonadaceae bacterium]
MKTSLETYLEQFSESDWLSTIDSLEGEIHEVDRNATQIWFRFYPLEFRRFIEKEPDAAELRRSLGLLGDYDLADQIDTSHKFLYGHRYWKGVKAGIEAKAETFSDGNIGLVDEIRKLASSIAEKLKVDVSLVLGITSVGLMTLSQVGLEKFKAAAGDVEKPTGLMAKSPDQIVSERNRDDSQGILGFLRTVDKKFSVTYTDKIDSGKFRIINDEEIASASARDQSHNWRARDERCWEGVVPVECRSASCGTCWIGVLAGEEKLSEVGRRERRMMKVFGYNQPEEDKPILRLACQTKAYGNATIVIPPWNGVFGKRVYGNVEELELEPVTTSAKKLRETIDSVVGDQ